VPVALEVWAKVVKESDFLHLVELEHLGGFIDKTILQANGLTTALPPKQWFQVDLQQPADSFHEY
jgi:hypothetical protein